MSPQDVRDRLGDRFRLLSGGRRGLERHQTLRHAVGWSYDLLGGDERTVLQRCSVFAGGFTLAAAAHLNDNLDEYAVLDVLDSLVRKSLVTTDPAGGHVRYGLLETIRQFAEGLLAATATIDDVRDRHARYYAAQAAAHWDIWDGPGYRVAAEWVDTEFTNLRTAFRWATDRGDLVTATAIAAHTSMIAFWLQMLEPSGWAEEILPAATTAEVAQLPRLYTAAGMCGFLGRVEAGVEYSRTALGLADDARYDPFDPGITRGRAATSEFLADGDLDRVVDAMTALAEQGGLGEVFGLTFLLYLLPGAGRAEQARAIAPQALTVARAHANPAWIAWALIGVGRAFADTEPARALDAVRQALVLCQEQRIPYWEARAAQEAASLETDHGDANRGLDLFDASITSYHLASNRIDLSTSLAGLAVYFDRAGPPETAAALYGTASGYPVTARVLNLATTVEHLRTLLGWTVFDQCVAAGAAMEQGDAVAYARHQIRTARAGLAAPS